MNKKKKQVLAMIAIVLLAGMYVSSLVLAFINTETARTLLKISFICTLTIPVIIYILMMMFRLTHRNYDINEEDNNDNKSSNH